MGIQDRIEKALEERPLLLAFVSALVTVLLAVLAMADVFP
jgi:hypothetical protein